MVRASDTLHINKAKVIAGHGPDKVVLYVDGRPEACWPHEGDLTVSFNAAAGSGAQYVKTHFGLTAEIINI